MKSKKRFFIMFGFALSLPGILAIAFAFIMLMIVPHAHAQQAQPSVVDQVDQALSMERAAANTALNVKDQRIKALEARLQ